MIFGSFQRSLMVLMGWLLVCLLALRAAWATAPQMATPSADISSSTLALASATIATSHASAADSINPAQPAGSAPADAVTPAAIESLAERIRGQAEMDEADRQKALSFCQKAQAEIERLAALQARLEEFHQKTAATPARKEEIRTLLAASPAEQDARFSAEMSLESQEAALAAVRTDLETAQKALIQWEGEPQRRATRLLAIPEETAAATREVADIEQQQAAPADSQQPADVGLSRQLWLKVRRQSLQADLELLQAERENYETQNELLPLERDLAEQSVQRLTKLLEQGAEIVAARRKQAAEDALARTVLEKALAYPALRHLADDNQLLAEEVEESGQSLAVAVEQTSRLASINAQLEREFQSVTEKYNSFGLAEELGPALLQYRLTIQQARDEMAQLVTRGTTVASVRRRWMEHLDERKQLGNLDQAVLRMLSSVESTTEDIPASALEAEVTKLLNTRRQLLDSANLSYEKFFRELVQRTVAENKLKDELIRQEAFIDERILWMRSTSSLGWSDLRQAVAAGTWLTDAEGWKSDMQSLLDRLQTPDPGRVIALLIFVGLLTLQSRGRQQLRMLGEQARRAGTDSIWPTLQAAGWTVLAVIPWPLAMWYVGWELSVEEPRTPLAALAYGLKNAALMLAPLEGLRQICRPHGLADAHFGWPPVTLRKFRRCARWLVGLGLPIVATSGMLHAEFERAHVNSLGRILFLSGMLLTSAFAAGLLRPNGNAMQGLIARDKSGWARRLRFAWYPVAVGGPLTLAVLAWLGYYFTAMELAKRWHATIWLVIGTAVTSAFAMRWLLVTRRRLSIQQLKQRRAALQQKTGEDSPGALVRPALDAPVDLTEMNQQTRRLVHAGLGLVLAIGVWLAWADVLPALSSLNMPLWYTTAEVTHWVPDVNGVLTPQTTTGTQAVDVSRVFISILLVAALVIAGRNFPGLLEMAILQRLPMTLASRYAIITLSRYLVTIVGLIVVCNLLGIGWAKIQWLLAAVSVGLGFGLQEIFANLVSGIIILFERPIRVGDVVTLGEISGVVSKIRIRATTITDFDRKELVVPNREFITGHVLNWTLSDNVNRVIVNVGLAYGSDIAKAKEILLALAGKHPEVLKDPAPVVSVEGFGDSSLQMVLRCFLPNLDNRLNVIHDMHTSVHEEFRQAGIEIAYPHREIRVRMMTSADNLPWSQAAGNNILAANMVEAGHAQETPSPGTGKHTGTGKHSGPTDADPALPAPMLFEHTKPASLKAAAVSLFPTSPVPPVRPRRQSVVPDHASTVGLAGPSGPSPSSPLPQPQPNTERRAA